ncbi:MAG TPA: hypothetical protein VFS11_05995 [Gemmatimonadales bacterium]|nr:hypothetical protein [Gemmatimonadales bacterium]
MAASAALTAAIGAHPAAAQTLFAWPDTTVDLSTYTTPEQCLVLTSRVRQEITSREARDSAIGARDTLPFDPHWAGEPLPAAVVAAASQCASGLGAPTAVAVEDYVPVMQLYLQANRDGDAANLLTRRLATVKADRKADRLAVLDSALDVYFGVQPVRFAAAESLLAQHFGTKVDRMDRMRAYAKVLEASGRAGDSTRVRQAAARILRLADSLTPAERQSDAAVELNLEQVIGLSALLLTNTNAAALDSLRQSTAAYSRLLRQRWATAMQARPEGFPIPIGERAAPLEATHWFPHGQPSEPPPLRGRASLLVFFDHARCLDGTNLDDGDQMYQTGCFATAAAVRRLAARFPALDITIVSGTHGYFMFGPPVAPDSEAQLIDKWIQALRVPGRLAVATTPFGSLPAPDGRRIDRPERNLTNYSFGKTLGDFGAGLGVLVDQAGLVVQANNMLGMNEDQMTRLIEILLQRSPRGS